MSFNLPTPKTALGKLFERAVIVGVIASLGFALQDPQVAGGGIIYLVVKTAYDLLNSNVDNL